MPQLLTRSGALYPPATTADFPSERWPVSRRNAGRLQPGMVADFASESLAGFNWNSHLNEIDPQAWLADVLARIADHPVNRLSELLPWNWGRNSAAIAA